MAYEVLSIGDAEMLYNAFQGTAMIFGNNNLNGLIKAGFTLGLLLISFRYLTNQEFPLQYALVGLILYWVMFIPKDTVIIEDVYTGEVRTVANVPLGVAMPMSVISTMGVKITELFETAFSTPTEASMLQHGYLDSLNTLIKLRNIGAGTAGSDSALGGDLAKSINAYIENCVMFDLEIATGPHEVTREKMEKSPDLWADMKTTFINRDIMVYLPSKPEGEQKSCEQAYITIDTYINGEDFKAQWAKYTRGVLGIRDQTVDPEDRINVAAQALSIAAINAQTYMRNALMASYLKDGPAAFIKRTGREQLNLQWAGEQSMFNEISRPLMAFVEMFTVATSPIVAFLATLGPVGMSMMVRYFQMMIWIALWGPVMAVCNLYITIATTRIMEAMSTQAVDNGSALSAMVMHDQLYQTLETWLSAGGMLASSVPALSLMLVYGGSVAATNLSGKMTSGASSSVNPGRLAPDPISMESPMKLGSMTEYSANVGAKKSGMADTLFSASSTFSRATQSATDSLRSSSATASQTLSSMEQSTQRSGTMNNDVQSIMSGVTNTINAGSNWANTNSRSMGRTEKMTQAESEAVEAGVRGGLSVGGGAFISAAVTSELMSKTGSSAGRASELADVAQNVANSGSYGGNETSTTRGSSQQHSNQAFSGTEEMKAQSEQYAGQLQAVDQAMEKYTETASLQDSAAKSLTLPMHDLARRLNDTGAIVDIVQATSNLEKNMSPNAFNELYGNAQREIDNSSASLPGEKKKPEITGGDRAALAGYLMLNQQDPIAAAAIMDKYLAPTSPGSGVNFSHAEHEKASQSVADIVSNETAADFRSRAIGKDSDPDTSGGVEGRDGRGQSSKSSAPQIATHQDHGQKTSAVHGAKNSSPASGGKQGSSGSAGSKDGGVKKSKSDTSSTLGPQQEVENALKNANLGSPDEIRARLKSGGHLDDNKNMSGMLDRAAENERRLIYDNHGKNLIHSLDAAVDLVHSVDKSTDKPYGSDSKPKHSNTSDNDFPPIPKE